MVGSAPGRSSPGRKVRPSSGRAPSTSKRSAEATVDIRSDEPASVCSVTASLEYAASDSHARARSFTKSNSTPRQL